MVTNQGLRRWSEYQGRNAAHKRGELGTWCVVDGYQMQSLYFLGALQVSEKLATMRTMMAVKEDGSFISGWCRGVWRSGLARKVRCRHDEAAVRSKVSVELELYSTARIFTEASVRTLSAFCRFGKNNWSTRGVVVSDQNKTEDRTCV